MGRIRIRVGKLAEEAGMNQADVVRTTGLNKDLVSKYFNEDTDKIYLRDLANKKKPTTMAKLADIWYTSQGENYGRNQHYNGSRYRMLYVQ